MPQGITVAVGAVIEDGEGGILLVKHRPERERYWPGRWICPGGGLWAGESIEDGIKEDSKDSLRKGAE